MNEESQIIKDFFNLVSADKLKISNKDIENFEIFVHKTEFEDIRESLNEFINDLVYWYVQKLELNINVKDDGQINQNVIHQLKKNISDKRNRSNSYKLLYERNLEFKKIKNSEIKKSLRNLIKNNSFEAVITWELFSIYFEECLTYKELIFKSLPIMRDYLINQHILSRQPSADDFYNNKKKKSKKKITKTNYKEENEKTDDNTGGNKTDEERNKNLNKSDISKNNKSSLSDNEIVIKNKENFLKVLKDVTNNIINEKLKVGGTISIKIEPEINYVKPLDKSFENKNKITFSENIIDKNIIKENDIKLNITEKENTKEINIIPNIKIASTKLNTNDNNTFKEENNKKRKKENCKCGCLIF